MDSSSSSAAATPILALLHITPSPASKDYVANKTQFQLHTLLTEQRHADTMDIGRVIRGETNNSKNTTTQGATIIGGGGQNNPSHKKNNSHSNNQNYVSKVKNNKQQQPCQNQTQPHENTHMQQQAQDQQRRIGHILAGLTQLLQVDTDIATMLAQLMQSKQRIQDLNKLCTAMTTALLTPHQRIYFYGCGATGRLAKQMESAFWRPFWERARQTLPGAVFDDICGSSISGGTRTHFTIEERLVGEMTGADRALISSLEGLEDLQVVGERQLNDHGISKGDVVVAVTEGGETSSVIGTILTALAQYNENDSSRNAVATADDDAAAATLRASSNKHHNYQQQQHTHQYPQDRLFFVYNNPDKVLMRLDRSRTVITSPNITKINLTTGPQALSGSTRMQATTSETFVMATALHIAVQNFIVKRLDSHGYKESRVEELLQSLGFRGGDTPSDGTELLVKRLQEFEPWVLNPVRAVLPSLAPFTLRESDTYRNGGRATYLAATALVTVFIDNTERSPTFRLLPLDTIHVPNRLCWLRVWTPERTQAAAWHTFLRRPFKGLEGDFYRASFEAVQDPILRAAALRSLSSAGGDQKQCYDFSFPDRAEKAPGGDLAVLVLMGHETEELLHLLEQKYQPSASSSSSSSSSPKARAEGSCSIASPAQRFDEFVNIFGQENIVVVAVTDADATVTAERFGKCCAKLASVVIVCVPSDNDPMLIRQNMVAKMLLNAHSTAIMAHLGKTVGNTMTNVSPSNLKLIGRATFLIQSHVNHTLACWQKEGSSGSASSHPPSKRRRVAAGVTKNQHGSREMLQLSYVEANAVLFEAISFCESLVAKHASSQNDRQGDVVAAGQTPEVALGIIRVLESVKWNKNIGFSVALDKLRKSGLEQYLATF